MSKYIGDVSAYAYAVSKGYTGTEEEFAELMADYADVGQRAEDAAESALNSKTAAQTAAQTATTKAGEASTSATSASSSASAASASASQASGSATNAANSATAASGSATSAAGSATTASTKASEASASATAAQTAQTAAETAKTAAETAQEAAEEARDEAETTAQSISASAAQIATNTADITQLQSEVSQKANVDGAYSDLTAGNAEQLVSTVYEEDSVPYIFRTAGGFIDIGDREEDMLVGGTVVWNQLVPAIENLSDWYIDSARISMTFANNVATLNKLSGIGDGVGYTRPASPTTFVVGHKYLASIDLKGTAGLKVTLFSNSFQAGAYDYIFSTDNAWVNVSRVFNADTNPAVRYSVWIRGTGPLSVDFKNYIFIDLTQMFGSTIADYIYSLETATSGAGVAWFRKLFPADYYPYDAGTLKSVEGVSAHEMVGFNAWDEEWELGLIEKNTGINVNSSLNIRSKNFIPVIPSTNYYYLFRGKPSYVAVVVYYDKDKKYIGFPGDQGYCGNVVLKTPDNCHYVRFYCGQSYGTTYNHDICINLSWDGERNGEYEPYVKHSYPLDSSLTLRGIPKLDSANNLYYDGDTYESDGTVTRKYGIVDLGTLGAWMEYSGYPGLFYLNTVPSGAKIPASNTVLPSLIANGYIAGISRDIGNSGHTKGEIALAQNRIYISNDAYTGNASGFRTAISGVYLVYELATPTTETAEPYQNPQIVDDFGTEEYVTTSIVPVGHVTKYQPNLRAKLEMSPDSPDGDGDYIVRQSNGENSYVSLASTATIQDILARLTALEGNTNEG